MSFFHSLDSRSLIRLLLLLVGSTILVFAEAQQKKGPLQLAEQYYAAGEYYTAANLYEQWLNPIKTIKPVSDFPLNVKRRRTAGPLSLSREEVLGKQAEAYRLAHYWKESAAAWQQLLSIDSIKHIDANYWLAVCQRNLGQYKEAGQRINQYLQNGTGQYSAAANQEKESLVFIAQQLKRPDIVLMTIKKLSLVGSAENGLFAPAPTNSSQFLFSSTATDQTRIATLNHFHSRLAIATVNSAGLSDWAFLNIPGIDSSSNQGAASLSADGNSIYFTQWKNEGGRRRSAIYVSRKAANGWTSATLINSINTAGNNSQQPFCTADGQFLYFSSDREGGTGKMDIWYAPIQKDGTIGNPVNAGKSINTTGDEVAPFYHQSSNTLVFATDGKPGMGGLDLFSATGTAGNWSAPENLGHPINSSRDDIYFYASENTTLLDKAMFSSDRGTGCCLETYEFTKKPKSRTYEGIIRDCRDQSAMADATITFTDANGRTFQSTTDGSGRYRIDPSTPGIEGLRALVTKDGFKDLEFNPKVGITDSKDPLIDHYFYGDVCLEKKLVLKVENVVTVYFDFDRSLLKPMAVAKLDSLYQVMQDFPTATLQISGYTDGRGSVEYNKILSDKRAKACADYLIQKGIDSTRISFESFGACCPVEMELINGRDNPDGRSQNRRALINVTKD